VPHRARLVVLGLIALAAPPARADPLYQAELQLGYGLAMSGSGPAMSRRASPLTITATAVIAIDDAPPLAGYGGLVVETLDRNAAGAAFGVRLSPTGGRLHLSGGGVWIVAPYSLVGATASGGACLRATARAQLCGDLQLTAYFAGSDLADGHAVTQAQLVAGMVFDAP
jgi:hypothetical protein